jgi:hypothetical protein
MIGKKMIGIRVLLAICLIAALVFTVITVMRMRLPYDESGVYFDEDQAVTYDTDGLLTYGVLAGVFSFISGLLYYLVKKNTIR